MIDRSKRYVRPQLSVEDIVTLKGKRLSFESVAEMLAVRAREIHDAVQVLFYDEVITYAQTNERAKKVAHYKLPEFVEFMKSFRRNPTGKILKQELKKMKVVYQPGLLAYHHKSKVSDLSSLPER